MSYASPETLLQANAAEEGFGLGSHEHALLVPADFAEKLPDFIDEGAKAHLVKRASRPFAAKRRAQIKERIDGLLKAEHAVQVPAFFLELLKTGEWDILGDIAATDSGLSIWEPEWEGQTAWESRPDRDLSGGSFFKKTIAGTSRLSRLFAIQNPTSLVVLVYVRLGLDLCGHPSIMHGGMSSALMDELLGMLAWESFHIPLFTANLNIDYRKPMGMVDEWEGGKCKEVWAACYVTKKEGRKTFAQAYLMVSLIAGGSLVRLSCFIIFSSAHLLRSRRTCQPSPASPQRSTPNPLPPLEKMGSPKNARLGWKPRRCLWI